MSDAAAISGAFAEKIVEEVFDVVLHADLARVFAGVPDAHAAADPGALVGGFLAGAVKGQREAAQHGSDNPAGVAIVQQQAGGLAFLFGDPAVADFDVIDQHPGDGVRHHGHSFAPRLGMVMRCGGGGFPPQHPSLWRSEAAGRPGVSQSRIGLGAGGDNMGITHV